MKDKHKYLNYGRLCTGIALPLGDLITRQSVMSAYSFYSESQWWDRDRLVTRQKSNLLETIRIAYTQVPFYRDLYDRRLVQLSSIKSCEDLRALPVVTKDMLRSAYPNHCTRSSGLPWREYFTSGSSGNPFAVRVDSLSNSHARALMILRATFSGWKTGEPFLQTGMSLKRGIVKRIKDILMMVQYVSAFDLSDRVLDEYLELLDRKKLRYLMGYPGSIYFLASRAGKTGFNLKMDGIVTWGDNLYAHYRETIEKEFGCKVTDSYGCGEGIQVAAQCGMNKGEYHIFMPHVAVEIVDNEGNPVKDGDLGNILLTRLDPGAMPLIRYKVGDVGRKSNLSSCPCGRGLELLASVDGRESDVILTPRGNRLIVHFFTGIFEYYPSIHTFRVVQDTNGAVTVQIVPYPTFESAHWEKIKQEIFDKGDPDLDLRLEIVEEKTLAQERKRRFVISHFQRSDLL